MIYRFDLLFPHFELLWILDQLLQSLDHSIFILLLYAFSIPYCFNQSFLLSREVFNWTELAIDILKRLVSLVLSQSILQRIHPLKIDFQRQVIEGLQFDRPLDLTNLTLYTGLSISYQHIPQNLSLFQTRWEREFPLHGVYLIDRCGYHEKELVGILLLFVAQLFGNVEQGVQNVFYTHWAVSLVGIYALHAR